MSNQITNKQGPTGLRIIHFKYTHQKMLISFQGKSLNTCGQVYANFLKLEPWQLSRKTEPTVTPPTTVCVQQTHPQTNPFSWAVLTPSFGHAQQANCSGSHSFAAYHRAFDFNIPLVLKLLLMLLLLLLLLVLLLL